MTAARAPEEVLLATTGRSSTSEAIEWIADGHPIALEEDPATLLGALIPHLDDHDLTTVAIRRIARSACNSDIDTASVLFDLAAVLSTSDLGTALSALAHKCDEGSLETISPPALSAAQRSNSLTIEALCAVAGLSYSELTQRVPGLPSAARGRWSPKQIKDAFDLIDDLVQGHLAAPLPGTVSSRAIEFMPRAGLGSDGWAFVERLRTEGVPYELLLAQRAAGSAWLAHRNRTSSRLAPLIADRLCQDLDARQIPFRRSSSLGGDTRPAELSATSGCDRQVGVLTLDKGARPVVPVIFSIARDSGTASKNASRLRAMKRPKDLPVSIVVCGPGWMARNETADLAIDFEGRLYSDRSLSQLADMISREHDSNV